jgi:SagB-type dehydrogenase family enzyme
VTPGHYRLRIRQDQARDPRLLESVSIDESAGIRAALDLLLQDEATEDRLTEIVRDTDGPEAVPRLFYWLTRLQQAGQLQYGLRLSDGSGVDLLPQRPDRVFHDVRFDDATAFVASRFAFIRRHGSDMQIESPLRAVVLRFRSWLPGAVMALSSQPVSAQTIAHRLPGALASDAVAVVEMLVLTGFLEVPREDGATAEGLWDFHELLFHARSSTPRLGESFAGLHVHRQPERPAARPAFPDSDPIALPPPRLEQWMKEDPPLARVIEDRKSATVPASHRLTLEQVSEFLYRTMHPHHETHRVLPSAGARHELELYAVVHDVESLIPGCYHYQAQTHRLHRLPAPDDAVKETLRRATAVWSSGRHTPDMVIVLATRFPRMASRYASIAYRNTLLDAGIAVEAMYLNATAMRLAPCALGINLPELFVRMTGMDPFEETAVAMFALSGLSE